MQYRIWYNSCFFVLYAGVPYQLDQIASEAHNQPKISAFFASENSIVFNDSETWVTGQIKPKLEDLFWI